MPVDFHDYRHQFRFPVYGSNNFSLSFLACYTCETCVICVHLLAFVLCVCSCNLIYLFVQEQDLKLLELESENRKMKVELEEFRTEAAHLKNQQATIRRLEERNRQLEQQVIDAYGLVYMITTCIVSVSF